MKNVNGVLKLQGTDTFHFLWVMLSSMTCSPCSVYNVSLKFHNVMSKRSLLFTSYISVFLCTSVVFNYCAQWYLVLTGSLFIADLWRVEAENTLPTPLPVLFSIQPLISVR